MTTDKTSPKSIATGFRDAWNTHDADAIAELFIEDASFVNVTGLWWNSKDRIRQAHQFGFDHIFGSSTLKLGRTEVRRLTEDYAVVHARMIIDGQTTPDGQTADTRRTVFSFVVARQSDVQGDTTHWLAVSAHNTDIAPKGEDTHVNLQGSQTPTRYR